MQEPLHEKKHRVEDLRRIKLYLNKSGPHIPKMSVYVQEPLHEKKHRVEELLEMLALQSCKDIYIGDSLSRGISGGQVRPWPCV